jgi:hypothetical protein
MSKELQGVLPIPFPGRERAPDAETSKELLRLCLQSVHELSRCYFYRISAEESIPGSLSYLLNIREAELVEIFKICGFYNDKKQVFLLAAFRTWIAASFEAGAVEVTSFRKKSLIKIGLGDHPRRPADQLKEKLDPPRFRMQTAGGEGERNKSFMKLFDKRSQTLATMTSTTTMDTTTDSTTDTTPPTTTTGAASPSVPSSPVKLSQRFNITSPDKPKLAMELISEMDTPTKAPLMRKLVNGSTITIETLNNTQKKYIHIPQCSNELSAMTQAANYKYIQEIVDTLGAGAEKVQDSLSKGALWLCRGLVDLYRHEFVQAAARQDNK